MSVGIVIRTDAGSLLVSDSKAGEMRHVASLPGEESFADGSDKLLLLKTGGGEDLVVGFAGIATLCGTLTSRVISDFVARRRTTADLTTELHAHLLDELLRDYAVTTAETEEAKQEIQRSFILQAILLTGPLTYSFIQASIRPHENYALSDFSEPIHVIGISLKDEQEAALRMFPVLEFNQAIQVGANLFDDACKKEPDFCSYPARLSIWSKNRPPTLHEFHDSESFRNLIE